MDKAKQEMFERNLKRYRRWIHDNDITRIIQGYMPAFTTHAQDIAIVVSDDLQPRTDGTTVFLSLIPNLLDDKYSEEDWLIAMRAIVAHELQHVNSSNFKDIETISSWYGKYLQDNYELDNTIGQSIGQSGLNTVEDGRIESISITERPGMFLPFQYLNDVIRNGTSIAQKGETPKDEYQDFWGNVLSYAKTGLYSPGIDAYGGTEMESNFLAIREYIDECVSAKTSEECRKLTQELLEEISPYLANLIKNSPELEESLKSKPVDEYTSSDEKQFNNGSPSQDGNPLRSGSPVNGAPQQGQQSSQGQPGSGGQSQQGQEGDQGPQPGQKDDECQKPNDKKSDSGSGSMGSEENRGKGQPASNESPMGFCNAKDEAAPLDKQRLDEVRDMMSRDIANAKATEKAAKKASASDGLSKKDIENIRALYGGATMPFNETTIRITGKDPISPDMKAQAMLLRRDISRIQAARQRAQKGLRRGTLDAGSLWKVGVKDETLFCRKGHPDVGSAAFYILIDNSGSMHSLAVAKDGKELSKYQAARSAAAVIEDAVEGLVPCKIALFNQSDRKVNHNVIRTFDEHGHGVNHAWNSLTAIGPGGCNTDSINIRVAAEELSRRNERKKVLLVLSDGEPSAYASRTSAQVEVREAVNAARRKGIIVIPIMFGDEAFVTCMRGRYEAMYEKNIVACAPQQVAEKLAALLRLMIAR